MAAKVYKNINVNNINLEYVKISNTSLLLKKTQVRAGKTQEPELQWLSKKLKLPNIWKDRGIL